jgi:hypothetical protein
MYIPKKYGESKVENCPFCGKSAVTKNDQGLPVCSTHKLTKLGELKCICGEYLDMRIGKWGVYFICTRCGNINLKKALEMNPMITPTEARSKDFTLKSMKAEPPQKRKVETIRSDDPRYFD